MLFILKANLLFQQFCMHTFQCFHSRYIINMLNGLELSEASPVANATARFVCSFFLFGATMVAAAGMLIHNTALRPITVWPSAHPQCVCNV